MRRVGEEYSGIQLEVRSDSEFRLAWSNNIQIIYQLAGRAQAKIEGTHYVMTESDLFVLNPFEVADISLQGTILCASLSDRLIEPVQGIYFSCRSFCYGKEEQKYFTPLRTELAKIFEIYMSGAQGDKCELLSHAYAFLNLLTKYFADSQKTKEKYEQHYTRLVLLLRFMHDNYEKKITLNDLAEVAYLAPNYISHFFKKTMGITFSEYLNDIRMNNAKWEICHTTKNITSIAMDNGYSSPNVFITRFRSKYGVTPKKYRAAMRLSPQKIATENSIDLSGDFQSLLKYTRQMPADIHIPNEARVKYLNINAEDETVHLHHDWKCMINAGYASNCLNDSVQKDLAIARKEIGFEYVRFHGIFNDNMQIYFEDANGTPYLRFQTIDLLLDKLIELSYKPYIEFGYIPALLASDTRCIFESKNYICYPKSIKKWNFLVYSFLTHIIRRYGIKRVHEWRFSLFGISFTQYGHLTQNEYFSLHKSTYRTVKSIDRRLVFCAPGFEGSLLTASNEQISMRFLRNCMEEGCLPDIITVHSYPHSFEDLVVNYKKIRAVRDPKAILRLSDNERFMHDVVCSLKKVMLKLKLELPILISEWSSTIWPRDPNNDTHYKASYIIKNMLENMDVVSGKGYWTLSDGVGEWKPEQQLFYGGQGLFTYNGIPKAAFHAFSFLAKLGEDMLTHGDGYYVTHDTSGIQVLLYNYLGYTAAYQVSSDKSVGHPSAEEGTSIKYMISVKEPVGERFKLRYYKISCENGNASYHWEKLGKEAELTVEDKDYLSKCSIPARSIEFRNSLENIEVVLEPNDVVLLLIDPA